MRVYTTKYALTTGIEVKDVEYGPGDRKYVYTKMIGYHQQFVMGKDAFKTWTDAATAARAMRNKKQLSLQRQLKKITGLIFPAREPKP